MGKIETFIEPTLKFVKGVIYGVIYLRVSSDEQVKGTSLEFQKKMCLDYCERKGIKVIAIFVESETAKDLSLNNRKEFLRAMEFCRKHKPWTQAFTVLRVDRFARNTEDHFAVRKILLDYGTTLHSVTETIGNKPSEKFIETVLAGAAEYDNAIRTQRSSDGMSQRISQGIFPWKPPIGYKCSQFKKKGEKKTLPDPPDRPTFDIIQQGLKEFAKGTSSPTEIAHLLDRLGLDKIRGVKTDVKFIDRLTGRYAKFYAGLLDNPFTKETDIQGQHLAMITVEEYQMIMYIRSGKARSKKKNIDNPNFPLKSIVVCNSCKESLTGGNTRGNGGVYPYYHCKSNKCPMYGKVIKKQTLEKEFVEYLLTITPTQKFLTFFQESVMEVWKEKGNLYELQAQKHDKQLAILEEKRKRVFEMFENSGYTLEEFKERKAEVENQITAEKISKSECRIDQLDIEAVISFASSFISNVARQWFDLSPQIRQRFQKFVLPEGISYHREKSFGTAKLGYIYEQNRAFDPKKSHLVPSKGIEPLSKP